MNTNSTTIDQQTRARTPGASARKSSNEFTVARGHLSAEIKAALVALRRSLYIERQALGLSLFDTGYRLAAFAAAALCGMAVALIATLLSVASARRGLQLLTDGAWWSDLALAILLLVLLAGAAHALRRFIHRSTLAETRRVLSKPAEQKTGAASENGS
jgi:multisubunit Na+/H+ antiporter MnhG subunit